jgi:hypothetical protein
MAELTADLRRALEADDAEDLHALVQRKRRADFEALQTLLTTDPSVPPSHRTKALHALGKWGDPVVVPRIVELLPRLDDRGRMSALSVLGRLGTPEAVAAIIAHAEDPSPHVRKFAAVGLGKAATPAARAKLREIAARDPVEWVRVAARRQAR